MHLSAISWFSGVCVQECTCGVLWQLRSHVTNGPCPTSTTSVCPRWGDGVQRSSSCPELLRSAYPVLRAHARGSWRSRRGRGCGWGRQGRQSVGGCGLQAGVAGTSGGLWPPLPRECHTRLLKLALLSPSPKATKAGGGRLGFRLLQHGTTRGPKHRHFLLQVLEAGNQRSSCPQPWRLVRAGFSACTQHLATGAYVSVCVGGCCWGQAVGEDSPVSSQKDTNPITGVPPSSPGAAQTLGLSSFLCSPPGLLPGARGSE